MKSNATPNGLPEMGLELATLALDFAFMLDFFSKVSMEVESNWILFDAVGLIFLVLRIFGLFLSFTYLASVLISFERYSVLECVSQFRYKYPFFDGKIDKPIGRTVFK